MNLPNALSLLRIFLALPVFLFLTAGFDFAPLPALGPWEPAWGNLLAGGAFALAMLTDLLDGLIARRRGLVTRFGRFIDPLADKVLVLASIIALLGQQRIPAWIAAAIVLREFVVARIRLAAAAEGLETPVSRGGKVCTVLQMAAVLLLILGLPGGTAAIHAAALLTAWTGIAVVADLCLRMRRGRRTAIR